MSTITRVLRRSAAPTALVTAAAMTLGTLPAEAAAKPAVTHLHMVVTPTTAKVGSTVLVTGTATPRVASLAVTLQRLEGRKWTTITSAKTTSTGAYTLHLKAPRTATTWTVRVSRAASRTSKAAVTGGVTVHVVPSAFVLASATGSRTLPNGSTFVVTGEVLPAATGSVTLQRLSGSSWVTAGHANLTKSAFTVSARVTTGAYTFRVSKGATSTVAGGVGSSFHLTVLPADPVITSTALPALVVGHVVGATLTAIGTGSLAWAVTAGTLPAGLGLSSQGRLSGRPLTAGTGSVGVTVTDPNGRTGTAALSWRVSAVGLSSWGLNTSGELGDGATTNAVSPTLALSPGGAWQSIAGGNGFAIGLRSDGTVWAWGNNTSGQLGIDSITSVSTPTELALGGVVSVAAGISSGYAVKSDGTVWAWGSNTDGELGDGTTAGVEVPQKVPGISTALTVVAGDHWAGALLSNGTAVAWGNNGGGQLGDGSGVQQHSPVAVQGVSTAVALFGGHENGYVVLGDGTLKAWGQAAGLGAGAVANSLSPMTVPGQTDVVTVVDSLFGAYALHTNGTVSAWGNNLNGRLGDGTTTDSLTPVTVGVSGVTALAGSEYDGYALTTSGQVFSWGAGSNDGLGNGLTSDQPTPAAVPGLTGVVDLFAGYFATYALVAGG